MAICLFLVPLGNIPSSHYYYNYYLSIIYAIYTHTMKTTTSPILLPYNIHTYMPYASLPLLFTPGSGHLMVVVTLKLFDK